VYIIGDADIRRKSPCPYGYGGGVYLPQDTGEAGDNAPSGAATCWERPGRCAHFQIGKTGFYTCVPRGESFVGPIHAQFDISDNSSLNHSFVEAPSSIGDNHGVHQLSRK
jgi:hypothetical protein